MEINVLERINMQITPINNTKFNGYSKKDVLNLAIYATKNKKGSYSDLTKKFDPQLVSNFVLTKKLRVTNGTQNWKLGENLTLKPQQYAGRRFNTVH